MNVELCISQLPYDFVERQEQMSQMVKELFLMTSRAERLKIRLRA